MKRFLLIVSTLGIAATSSFATERSLLSSGSGHYYDAFLFRAEGNCRDLDSVTFQTFTVHESPVLGQDSQGREVDADLRLNLFEDGTYWGEYGEAAVVGELGNAIETESVYRATIQGRWQITGPSLVIEGVGEGKPIDINGSAQVLFTFEKTFHDPRLVSRTAIMGAATTNVGPHGESVRQYCGVN